MLDFHRTSRFCVAKGFIAAKLGCGVLSLGVRFLHHKMVLKKDSTPSGIAVHFHGLWCVCKKDSALFGLQGTIAAQPSKCGAHSWGSSGVRYAVFQSAGAEHLLHSS